MKGSNYMSIMQNDFRYRIDTNPLDIVAPQWKDQMVKYAEASETDMTTIKDIIDKELSEDFKLGGHENYDYLLEQVVDEEGFRDEDNRVQDVKLCVVYIDLRNFSKRALFIDNPGYETIDDIANLKQEAISTWIKLTRFYQGHIHSNTGDGLMILIGGTESYDSDEWTLGARAFLLALRILESERLLNKKLKKILEEKGIEDSYINNSDNLIDIKVSVDYSPDTLMNPQGVIVNLNGMKKAVGEIKATAFEVDVCAKLLSNYKDVKKKLEGSNKLGRVLLFGNQYKELMEFKDEVNIKSAGAYEKKMYNVSESYSGYYVDVKEYKNEIITLEDIAKELCNVYDSSEEARNTSVNIARKANIQHG